MIKSKFLDQLTFLLCIMSHNGKIQCPIDFQENLPNFGPLVAKKTPKFGPKLRFPDDKVKVSRPIDFLLCIMTYNGNSQPPIDFQENRPNFGPPVAEKHTKIEVS